MTVVSLVLKASFSRMVILMVTFGWAAIYSLAISCQSVLPGSMVVICHHSMVTFLAGASVAGGCVGASVAGGACVAAGAWVAGACVGAGAPHAVSAKETMSKMLRIM